MAKKMKAETAAATIRGVSAADLKRVVRDINKHRENASENAGLAGQATKQAIEQYNLDRPALTAVVRLSRAEPSKQQATLRGIIDYADKLGMFNQLDAFDDLIPAMERIINAAKNRVNDDNVGRSDPVMKDLVGAPVH